MALGLSTSGDSANLLVAFAEAGRRGLLTVGIAGYGGGRMAQLALDHRLVVGADSVHRIQETQAAIGHALWQAVQGQAVQGQAVPGQAVQGQAVQGQEVQRQVLLANGSGDQRCLIPPTRPWATGKPRCWRASKPTAGAGPA